MDAVATVIAVLGLIIGIGVAVDRTISDRAEPSILEYCERTTHRWRLDECVYVQTRWRDNPPPPIRLID